MFQCCTRWEHVDETPYLIELDAADRSGSPLGELGDESEEEAEVPGLELEADWAGMDDELEAFMNETDTEDEGNESESESVKSENSTASEAKTNGKKRKHDETRSTDVSEAEDSDNSTTSVSKLQRRKKRTIERVTSLTNVTTLREKSSGLPSPETTGPEEGQGDEEEKVGPEANGVAPDLQDDYDQSLEAELMAGFDESDDE